jgi:hypothetical protein
MNRLFDFNIVLLVLASLTLSGCAVDGGSLPTAVDVQLQEPIGMNEPVAVTITVQARADFPDMKIRLLTSDPDISVEGEEQWSVNAQAHQPIAVTTTLRFPKEGYFTVVGNVYDGHGGHIGFGSRTVHTTPAGGTVNPPPASGPFQIVPGPTFTPSPDSPSPR